ncbi:endonuclease/exonuclease/phosphatase family protein [Pseudoruegeria sp. SK021]|uniref:endonuclease/exonuclease/phosphatase family protein n=1 Tax=Pseudoruegeria sp. SK021 TaxID=1933035 RepID=UPI000A226E9F|nr:endonuclease/exonuclease/phosphatase family protein [Pseudoruegeria sp. SK021]OSP56731.1 hypothetical protein BV911_01925 [Pseudoruegeria sp. SK021]
MRDQTRLVLLGVLAPIAILGPAIALTAQFFPDLTLIGTLARILESAAPQLLLAALPVIAAVALLGGRLLALVLLLGTLIGGAGLVVQHRAMSQPVDATARNDLTVLWYNMLWTNPTDPDRMVAALIASEADVVLLAEPGYLRGIRHRLTEAFPYQTGCDTTCGIVALSRIPVAKTVRIQPGPLQADRIMVLELDLPGRAPLTLAAMHLIKPWYYGITEVEMDSVLTTINGIDGPLIVAGDFNSAPWSQRMRWVARSTGLALPRRPIPTWPAAAGPLAVPLDHILVRDGPVLRRLEPWGDGLGSDHRGLLAEISLPAAP